MTLSLTTEDIGPDGLDLTEVTSVIAGYTGRDRAAVEAHIEELAEIGVPRPPSVPMFYPVASDLVTTATRIEVSGGQTSGEVEPVLIRRSGRHYLGIGSDHTDREVETRSVAESKRACPKPMGSAVIEVGAWTDFDWDACHARCWADDVLYQDGPLSALTPPAELLEKFSAEHDLESDYVCFAGTLPLHDGAFRYARNWRLELRLPDGRVLRHAYDVHSS